MTRGNALICLLLAGITLGIYWPVHQFDSIYYDDPQILTDCPVIQHGFTWPGVKWALTSVVLANWQPATNLSFLAVAQFFQNTPGAHHLANAMIHAVNAALVFLLLWRMTGARWRSAVAAGIFAWHPLRVESVAWIAERKDVLCAFFFLLSLLAYVRYAQRRPIAGVNGAPLLSGDFWLALLAFAMALLSKPMSVTLPFVLLLLDFWPLQRMTGSPLPDVNPNASGPKPPAAHRKLSALCLEKWPFFILTVLFCFVTYQVQRESAAVAPWDMLGADLRIADAVSGYGAYLAKLFWPSQLAVIYQLYPHYDLTAVALKAALLLAISLGCITRLASQPWLAMGWFWYLGTCLPVIGLVQVGGQSMADRYTYLPLIGPVMAIVWATAEIFSRWRNGKIILAILSILTLSGLAMLSEHQLRYWRNTITLFEHTVAVTPENPAAMCLLGIGYEYGGQTNLALVAYRVTQKMTPDDAFSGRNLANLLAKRGYLTAAEAEYTGLLARQPHDYLAHIGLANVLALEGRTDDSRYLFQLNETIRENPDCIEALNDLAWELATSQRADVRDRPRAVTLAQRACELTGYQTTIFVGTLAAAYAEAGKFDDAVATAQQACDLARKNDQPALLQKNQELLEQYRQHKAVRE